MLASHSNGLPRVLVIVLFCWGMVLALATPAHASCNGNNPPSVIAISPASGPASGGTNVTVSGTSLGCVSVSFGGVAATGVVASANSVTATTPPGTAGPVTVTVTNPSSAGAFSGASVTLQFTYVGAASVATSTIGANPMTIEADGAAAAIITVQLKDANGNNLTNSGGVVQLSTTLGALGAVTDNGDGSYTAILTSAVTAGTATISGTLAGVGIIDTATVAITDTIAPLITGPSGSAGGVASAILVNENQTTVTRLEANEPVTWAIAGGDDADKFAIAADGTIMFAALPDFENPTDSDADNAYVVRVGAMDGAGNESFQVVTVSIGNVDEIGRKLDEIGDRLRTGLRTYATQGLSDMLSFNEGLMRDGRDQSCAGPAARHGVSGVLNANEEQASLGLNYSQNPSQCGRPYRLLANIGLTHSRMSGNWTTRVFGSLRFETRLAENAVIGLGIIGSRANDRLLGFADSSVSDNSLQASLYGRYRINETVRAGAFFGIGRTSYDFDLTQNDGFELVGAMTGKRRLFGWTLSGDFNVAGAVITTDAIVSRAVERLGSATLRARYKGERRSGIAFRVGTVDVTRVSVPVSTPIHLTGADGFGLASRLLLSPGLLCEDNSSDSSDLHCGYQLGAKLVANDTASGSFYADYRLERVGRTRRSLLGLGYAYRIGPKNGLELALEANRGITEVMGQDNRALMSLRIAR